MNSIKKTILRIFPDRFQHHFCFTTLATIVSENLIFQFFKHQKWSGLVEITAKSGIIFRTIWHWSRDYRDLLSINYLHPLQILSLMFADFTFLLLFQEICYFRMWNFLPAYLWWRSVTKPEQIPSQDRSRFSHKTGADSVTRPKRFRHKTGADFVTRPEQI